jgi:hypothetical protein
MECYDLVWEGIFKVFILSLYHYKVPDLNSSLRLIPPLLRDYEMLEDIDEV